MSDVKTAKDQKTETAGEARVLLERRGPVALVTVNRPKVLNALDYATMAEIDRVLDEIAGDEGIRGVIVTGAGPKSFVAGADIGELARETPLSFKEASARGQAILRKIERLGKPVVAAVNGYAFGGGCELALACHLRVMSRNGKIGLPEVKLGIIPGYAGTQRLSRVVGRGRALELVLTGDPIDADEAHRIGLVNRVVDSPEECVAEAEKLLGAVLERGPLAIRAALEAVLSGEDMSQTDGERMEANLFGLLAATKDMREGLTAFLEKRPAQFKAE